MKTCSKCKEEKELIDFNKFIRSNDGHRPDCRECQKISSKIYNLKYSINNKELLLEKSLKYRNANKEVLKEKSLDYYYNTKEIRSEKIKNSNKVNREGKDYSEYRKNYYNENKEKVKEGKKRYYNENKEKVIEYNRIYISNKIKSNSLFKLTHNIRSIINKSFRKYGFKKNTKTHNILGCSFEEFKLHIESIFEPWMNWDNKGLYNGELNYGWDIDHIIPISSATTEEDVYKLNHYTNLQPLCSKINRDIKRDQCDYINHIDNILL